MSELTLCEICDREIDYSEKDETWTTGQTICADCMDKANKRLNNES